MTVRIAPHHLPFRPKGRVRALKRVALTVVACLAPIANTVAAPTTKDPSAPKAATLTTRIANAKEVDLHELEVWAQEHAPLGRLARATRSLGAAAEVAAKRRIQENPTLSAVSGPRFLPTGIATDVQLSLNQPIEINGEVRARRKSARQMHVRLIAEEKAAMWRVHAAVHEAYYRALLARERAHLHQRILAFQDRLLEIAQGRSAAGDASPLVVRIAEGERSLGRVHLLRAEQDFAESLYELAEVCGWPAKNLPMPAAKLEVPRPPPALSNLLETAQRNHPELLAKRERILEAQARAQLADRERAPKPDFYLQWQREGGLRGSSQYIVFSGLSITLPLFARNQGARAMAQSEIQIAQSEVNVLEASMVLQIERAHMAVEAANARLDIFSREVLPSFEENLRLLEKAYELGEIDILTVGIGRERFLRGQDDALAAYSDYFAAISTLESLIGQELWQDEESNHVH
jgi:cobalt-zinc-cadmium efflux system outer membrane protein